MLTVMVLVMQTDAPVWDSLVFDGIDEVDIEAVTAAFGTVEVMARGRAVGAACPDCGRFSDRVHDRYQRRLKDLPLAGRPEGGPGPLPRTGEGCRTRPRLRRDTHRPPRLHTPRLDQRSRCQPTARPHRLRTPPAPRPRRRDRRAHSRLELLVVTEYFPFGGAQYPSVL
ncbi:transposase family protein [Streptomyces sp. NPDC013181]|uniref:transposase family protein n=1 Tax=Streptomyces sp. NPDC013181 TaxID=3364864 RepID=UPI0036914667